MQGRAAIAGVTLVLAAALVARAQEPRPTNPPPNPTVKAAADALGMVRWGDGGGNRENLDLVNRNEFVASGNEYIPQRGNAPWPAVTIRRLVFDVALRTTSSRVETVRVDAAGKEQRVIEVVHGQLAGNETEPGVGATAVASPSEAVAERRRAIKMLPQGFMRAVIQAGPKATLSQANGKTVLTVTIDGVPVTGTLGQDKRPETISMPIQHPIVGRTVLEARFSGYKDDEGYEVFFPSKIVHTLGGKPVLDLTVEKHMTGIYLIFPVPAVATSASR